MLQQSNLNFTLKCVFLLISIGLTSGLCVPDSHGGANNSIEVKALSRITSLQGLTWSFDFYTIGICTSELLKINNAGVVLSNQKTTTVLGRTNDTHAVSGDEWVLLFYYGGDKSNISICNGNFTSELLIICDRSQTTKGEARLIERDRCVSRFEIKSIAVCSPESPSTWSLIVIWSIFIFTLYCLVGIIYRRFKLRVQGRQQLPHLSFWRKIGAGCADCCNWACRCEEENVSTWDADTDRDDVLLRP